MSARWHWLNAITISWSVLPSIIYRDEVAILNILKYTRVTVGMMDGLFEKFTHCVGDGTLRRTRYIIVLRVLLKFIEPAKRVDHCGITSVQCRRILTCCQDTLYVKIETVQYGVSKRTRTVIALDDRTKGTPKELAESYRGRIVINGLIRWYSYESSRSQQCRAVQNTATTGENNDHLVTRRFCSFHAQAAC